MGIIIITYFLGKFPTEKYLDQPTVVLVISRENKFYLRFLIKYLWFKLGMALQVLVISKTTDNNQASSWL